MTEKLYYNDPYLFEFKAEVLSSEEDNGRYKVVLDRTCFYPKGGGQPADQGWLNNSRVSDVRLNGTAIIHYVEKPVSDRMVTGKIEAERRLDLMQQHTGQHIISQAMLRTGNYPTVSVHFGESDTAVEFDTPSISDTELREAEKLANRIVCENRRVKIHWVNPEEVHKFKVRRPPPEVNRVRIVEIDGFDSSACGGIHVSRTGEIGLIKFVGREKIRGHIRLWAKIGERAYSDYDSKIGLVQELMGILTCGEGDLPQRIIDLNNEVKDKKREINSLGDRWMTALARLAEQDASEINGVKFIQHVFEEVDTKQLKKFVEVLTSQTDRIVIVVSVLDNQLRWMIGQSLQQEINIPEKVKPLLSIIDGKGGGTSCLIQGGGSNISGIHEFISQFRQIVERELTI